jgi:Tol biopolymer transport system component
MTAFDRFDPFERRITEAIDEIAAARRPDYLDDIFRQTARTAQRPRWTFLERWLPVDTALARPGIARRVPIRPLLVLALLALLAAAAAVYFVGSRPHIPAPFGPAGNGAVVYASNGDLYVRDTLSSPGRLLIGGPNREDFAGYTPDGSHLTYVVTRDGADHLMVANADGTNPVEISVLASAADTFGNVSPDGKTFALVFPIRGVPTLSMVAMDGTSSRVIDLGSKRPLEVSWSPPRGDLLLIRAQDETGDGVDLYTLKPDGTGLRAFNLPGTSEFGTTYTLSGAVWTPDGKTIVYNGIDSAKDASGKPFDYFRLHLIAPDGSNDRAVPGPMNPTVQENWPAVSPDGKWIVAQDWSFGGTGGGVVILPADGSGRGRDIGPQFIGGDISKAWSPDGSRLLVGENLGTRAFLVDPVTGTWEQLTWATGLPDWQRIALP